MNTISNNFYNYKMQSFGSKPFNKVNKMPYTKDEILDLLIGDQISEIKNKIKELHDDKTGKIETYFVFPDNETNLGFFSFRNSEDTGNILEIGVIKKGTDILYSNYLLSGATKEEALETIDRLNNDKLREDFKRLASKVERNSL